ncbi:helix-turn-helix transcriptional regulator [Bacillus sp. Gen3]|nr:helix-turn-helix transcriptional regulator [Bacillus sp. Gen3]
MAKYKAKPRLKELLKEKGIDIQKEFALMVGVTEPTISRFDTQTRYDIDVLVSVSKALNVPIEELFYIEENEETDSK